MANYKGFSFPFSIDGRGGVAVTELTYTDVKLIEDSITQIIMTYPGERIMEPTFGCRLKDFLFENIEDLSVQSMIKYEITNAVAKWEPRVEIKDIAISSVTLDAEIKLFIDIYVFITQYQISKNIKVIV